MYVRCLPDSGGVIKKGVKNGNKTTYLPDTTSAEGYVCSSCGAWVGGLGWHSCWPPRVPQPVIPPPFMNPTPTTNNIHCITLY